MEGNQKTRIQKFMGGNKKGYQTAFHMAWPAVMESFFIALAGMVDSLMVSSMGPEAVAAVGGRAILVRTGKGRKTEAAGNLPAGTPVFDDLHAAAEWLISLES